MKRVRSAPDVRNKTSEKTAAAGNLLLPTARYG